MADIRAQLLAAFAIERADHLAVLRDALVAARRGETIDRRELFRRAHSLKGAARAVEMPAVEQAAHALETLLDDLAPDVLDDDTAAHWSSLLDRIEDGESGGDDAPVEVAAARLLRVPFEAMSALARAATVVSATIDPGDHAVAGRAALRAIAARLAADRPEEAQALLAIARELAAAERRVTLRRDATTRALDALAAAAERLMLVQAGDVLAPLGAMVRDLATQAGKRARLRIDGGDTEVDRRILDALHDPLVHALRNAVAHGIEPPADRERAGKPEEGAVVLGIAEDGGDLLVTVVDDGAGLDRVAIAHATGGSTVDPALFARLFAQGSSTAATVDLVSGRGVGLAIVERAARSLGGTVSIMPGPAGGTRLELRVPRALLRRPVIAVDVGGSRVAIAADKVAGVRTIDPAAFEPTPDGTRVADAGGSARVLDFAAIVGSAEAALPRTAALLLAGSSPTLLLVDALIGAERVLMRSADEIALAPRFVIGAAVLADGTPVAVVDPLLLVADPRAAGATPAAAAPPPIRRTVLVVDDSITTRTLERSILQAGGYQVLLAVDGVDGLERLREQVDTIDLVVADVEMPRMDGFGLLTEIRNDPALANIPVVMMTSRNSPDDIQRGLDLGAAAYVTKQDFDQGHLLATVARLI